MSKLPTLRADRREQLIVPSRPLTKPEPKHDAPFLEGIYTDVTPRRRSDVDWTQGWMGNGEAVYQGIRWWGRAMVIICFLAAMKFLVTGPTIPSGASLLKWCGL